MSKPEKIENCIDYVEFSVTDIEHAKAFYANVFDWWYRDYGPDYASFHDGRITGGFQKVDSVQTGGPLIVMYHNDLDGAKKRVLDNGGTITKEVFTFPGGKRFECTDPDGNALAVWTETGE